MLRALALALSVCLLPVAFSDMVITEWMYGGAGEGGSGEFVEFTNTGPDPVDMTGWSFDDNTRTPGSVSLSAFGVVAPGQSVILTDESAAAFAANWGLSNVAIIGGNTANRLGRSDEINLYNASGVLVDRLTYSDETYAGTARARFRSCNIPATGYGYTVAQPSWTLATQWDSYGSFVSSRGEIGSPGRVVGYAISDLDHDGDADAADFNILACCTTGPGVSYGSLPPSCPLSPDPAGFIAADIDQDRDVDLADWVAFQKCYSGAGTSADLACGRPSVDPGTATIMLNGNSIAVVGTGITVEGTRAIITAEGTYTVSGTLTNGQIGVNATAGGVVVLILNGVNITNSNNAAIYVMSADRCDIVLAPGTTNTLNDASTYVLADPEEDEPNASLFSNDPLTISGPGTLIVHGNYNDGIASKDWLVISDGTIGVTAADDGIRGKDYLRVQSGTITVNCGGDGLKSDNTENPSLGYVRIDNGTLNITSGGDAITAETNVEIVTGNFTFLCGGGHTVTIPSSESAKGIKGVVNVVIHGGTFNMDCADDGIHSNNDITINGGTFTVATNSSTSASYGDGLHADDTIVFNGGTFTVTTSFEGMESRDVTINNGTIRLTSTDDGLNAAGGSGTNNYLRIHGGYLAIYAAGDGIDVNGSITMTGGTVIVHGPTADNNAPIDFDVSFNISGGVLVAAGSAGMAQAPSATSTQRSVKITYSSWKAAGTLAHLETTATPHTSVLTFAPAKNYRSLIFSAPTLTAGTSFDLYRGGTCTGTPLDGLYQGGTYSGGTKTNTFTTTNIVTNVSAP